MDGLNLIKRALPCILPGIPHIFNHSFSYGVYPELWKTAIICPIPKVKCPSKLSDFRPISILYSISKVLERLAADQIKIFLKSHEIFDPCQAAYRRSFSTQIALIRVLDDVRQVAEREKSLLLYFLTFQRLLIM